MRSPGGASTSGTSEGVANPVGTVLSALGSQQGTTFTFVGTADHPVSCLNYGAGTVSAAQARTLTTAQTSLAQHALTQARMLVNPSLGILGAAVGKSSDLAGDPAVILYVDPGMNVTAALKWCLHPHRRLWQARLRGIHWNPALCIPSLPACSRRPSPQSSKLSRA